MSRFIIRGRADFKGVQWTTSPQPADPEPPIPAESSSTAILLDIDFKGNTSGSDEGLGTEGYLLTELNQDFVNTQANPNYLGTDILDIADMNGTSSRALYTTFPSGSVLTGNQWLTFLTSSDDGFGYEELYLSYNFMLDPEWEVRNGGKMPGLSGADINNDGWGPSNGSGTNAEFGFSAMMDWGASWNDGDFSVNLYHHDQLGIYGDSIFTGMQLDNGDYNRHEWHNVTQRIVENSILSESVGNNDGILEIFWDGVLVLQRDDLRFRNYSSMSINRLYHANFFSGSGAGAAPTKDLWMAIDDYLIFYYTGSDVTSSLPIGNVTSSVGRTLELPNWPKNTDINDPYAWYRFENNSLDSTGSNHGTNQGASYNVSDPMVGNYDLDLTNGGQIQLPELDLGIEFTICGWFRKETTSTDWLTLFSMEDTNGIGMEIYLDQEFGQWVLVSYPYNLNSYRAIRSTTGLFVTGSTYHWAFAGNLATGKGKVWINGTPRTSVNQLLWGDKNTPMLGNPIIGNTFGNIS